MELLAITWTVDPIIFEWGNLRVGWYGLFFGIGLIVFGTGIMDRIWRHEQLPEKWLSSLFVYILIAVVVGARLGHCLFYQPEYYLANPVEILKIWEGGLASHGAVIGIIIAAYIYGKRVSGKSMIWLFDRLCVPTGLVAAMIRLGNLMNHEIYGHPTDLPWGFRFIENVQAWRLGADPIFSPPSHPTQIYEALVYLFVFALCMWLYWRRKMYLREGFIFGVALTIIFTARFFIEFLKNDQVAFEANMTLNMGQWLSIPFIIIGIAAIVYSLKRPKAVDTATTTNIRRNH